MLSVGQNAPRLSPSQDIRIKSKPLRIGNVHYRQPIPIGAQSENQQGRLAGYLVTSYCLLYAPSHKGRAGAIAVAEVDPWELMATVREGLVVLDSDLTIRFANRSFCDTFAVKPDDAVGQKLYEVGN